MRQAILFLIVIASAQPLQAQWGIALRHGAAVSHGDAQGDVDPAYPELQAHRPATWTFALSRDAGAWRLGVDLHHTTADLAEIGGASTVATASVLASWGLGAEFARRIAGQRESAGLFGVIGASIDRWTFDLTESSPRNRAALRGAIEAEFPIGNGWLTTMRGEVSRGPSVFKADELPDGFTTRAATRLGIVLGLARRW
jgi:hypothetical protein